MCESEKAAGRLVPIIAALLLHAFLPAAASAQATERVGDLVTTSNGDSSSSTPLVTITQMDPLQVNFTLPESNLALLHKALVETGKAAQVFGFPLTGVNPGLHLFGATVKKGDPVAPGKEELIRILEGFGAAPDRLQSGDQGARCVSGQTAGQAFAGEKPAAGFWDRRRLKRRSSDIARAGSTIRF